LPGGGEKKEARTGRGKTANEESQRRGKRPCWGKPKGRNSTFKMRSLETTKAFGEREGVAFSPSFRVAKRTDVKKKGADRATVNEA